jgi:hypothetical protein
MRSSNPVITDFAKLIDVTVLIRQSSIESARKKTRPAATQAEL